MRDRQQLTDAGVARAWPTYQGLPEHVYIPFRDLADSLEDDDDTVREHLDLLCAAGFATLVYGRGYQASIDQITVAWADLKVTDINSGAAIGASETRYRIVAGPWDAWYVAYATDNMSGAEWQDEDGTLPDPDHVIVTDLPADVVERAWDVSDGTTRAPLQAVMEIVTEDVDGVYWDAWRERVAPVEAALKADLLPFTFTQEG